MHDFIKHNYLYHMKKIYFLILFAFITLVFLGCSKDGGDAPGTPDSGDDDKTESYIYGYFDDEVRPPLSAQIFNGAYYRKVVSSSDVWTGIEGTVVLPHMTFDPARVNPSKPAQYLDNPSVYMGGNMGGQETDIGMTWEVIRDDNGKVSADRVAFRPFLRRTACGTQEKNYSNAPAEKQYYWYPGEKITMSVRIDSKGVLRFIVDGAGKHYETTYECAGYSKGWKGAFKRVNAIDQVNNEGKPVQATKTIVEGGKWESTYLYRYVSGKDVKVPMHTGRFTDMRAPDVKYFKIIHSDSDDKIGAESITINGAGY